MKRMKTFLAALLSMTLAMPTTFAGVVAAEEAKTYKPGVTVETNENKEQDADYQVTFVYESDADIEKVTVAGNFQWHLESERDQYKPNNNNDDMQQFRAEDYKEGMYNSSGLHGQEAYELEETSEGHYEVTIPVPGNLYFYDYTIIYADGSKATIKDPANMPVANPVNGHDSGHSLVYVGNGANCTKGQEYIYPRTDGKVGKRVYLTYTASDGTVQPLEVYTPYGYDTNKEYPTLYVSHGGGGQEAEWMEIGAAGNIMDNLIASGEMAPVVMVTMDNTYFGFNAGKNIINNIIPFIEAKFAVSKDADDRAFCGLSSGSMQTNELAREYPNEFGYFGAFSGGNRDLNPEHYDKEALQNTGYYLSAGCIDMAYNNTMGISSIDYMKLLDTLEVDYDFELLSGAHDWGVWRESLTRFAKYHLWDVEVDTSACTPGVEVDGHEVTFVYKNSNKKIDKVEVGGAFQFNKEGDTTGYRLEDLTEEMYPVGYIYDGGNHYYQMTKVGSDTYTYKMILPSNQYFYKYQITYADGTVEQIKDPANMPLANGTADSGWSLFYVGSRTDATPGLEYIYPSAEQKGALQFVVCENKDGSTQPLGVYLPYGYNTDTKYPVLYLSHGGGGNEVEWFEIGSTNEIFDNLIAEGKLVPTIVVTMANTPSGFSAENTVENIIPYVESHYSVIKDASGRAAAGLSAGGTFAANCLTKFNDEFGYYGVWSPRNTVLGPLVQDGSVSTEGFDHAIYHVGVGNQDIQLRQDQEQLLYDTLKEAECDVTIDYVNGEHDWFVWKRLLTIFARDVLWTTKDVATGTQTIEVTGDAWGPAVTKTIVTLDTEIDAASIDAADFKVIETKEGVDWSAPGYPRISAETTRKVTKAYLCDENGNPTTAKTGKTIAIEMYVSPSEGSPFIYDMNVGLNSWCAFYSLDISLEGAITSEGKEVKALDVAKDIDLLDRTQTAIPQMADMTLTSYKGTDGIELSYAAYEPAKDDKTNALVIWLHGSGEGGTDPTINMLGNEVTRLVSDEFQKTMGGAYVIAPQSPVKWSYDGENQYCTGHTSGNKDGDTDSLYVATLTELIKDYVAKHPDIDPNRIIISGCSNGGYMTTRMIMANPGYFAAAVLNSESFMDANISDEQLKAIVDDEIGLWYIYCTADDVANSSIPTTQRLLEAKKDNLHIDIYDSVQDTSGRFTDAEGNPYTYNAHWAWIHFFTNYSHDGDLSVWDWMAKQARTPEQPGTEGGTTGGTTTPDTPAKPGTTPNVGIYNNVAYVAIATVALAGAAYVAFKKKED